MHIPTTEDLQKAATLAETIAADKAALEVLKQTKVRVKANEKELKRLLRGTTTRKPKAKAAATTDKPAKSKKQNQFGAFSGETKAGE